MVNQNRIFRELIRDMEVRIMNGVELRLISIENTIKKLEKSIVVPGLKPEPKETSKPSPKAKPKSKKASKKKK